MIFKEKRGGITAAKGFRACGIHSGVKKAKKDLALVLSTLPATASAVLTQNKVQAAPVLVTKAQLSKGNPVRALVVNSGNANACTGERGMADAWAMVRSTASALGVKEEEVLVSSTGVIGQFLPIDLLTSAISSSASQLFESGGRDAAEAIMTTDTFIKEYAVELCLSGVPVTIGGMAKGSGMIAPNMATMLAFVTTDAAVSQDALRTAIRHGAEHSFNRISVDGDTSTNDMLAILANGASGAPVIDAPAGKEFELFTAALEQVLVTLSKMIVRDGEGATKFVEIAVTGAVDEDSAVKAARAIASSSLVKTAINGEDANWGRILAAVGNAGIDFDPSEVEICFGSVPILRRNYTIDFSEEEAKKVLSEKEIQISVALNHGPGEARFWTCDLSKGYVEINANYRT
ncbi:MAG TPA: bifunctional glutamate N-acetyltransferase/amino-acid acetyltransferase ArgJ [Bacteroidota bacterium]|nr:bifunctional glutamate N-acetyltransferase/amino-acid acetyltransferase ArgJ [Bacteroidota bacterium]